MGDAGVVTHPVDTCTHDKISFQIEIFSESTAVPRVYIQYYRFAIQDRGHGISFQSIVPYVYYVVPPNFPYASHCSLDSAPQTRSVKTGSSVGSQ